MFILPSAMSICVLFGMMLPVHGIACAPWSEHRPVNGLSEDGPYTKSTRSMELLPKTVVIHPYNIGFDESCLDGQYFQVLSTACVKPSGFSKDAQIGPIYIQSCLKKNFPGVPGFISGQDAYFTIQTNSFAAKGSLGKDGKKIPDADTVRAFKPHYLLEGVGTERNELMESWVASYDATGKPVSRHHFPSTRLILHKGGNASPDTLRIDNIDNPKETFICLWSLKRPKTTLWGLNLLLGTKDWEALEKSALDVYFLKSPFVEHWNIVTGCASLSGEGASMVRLAVGIPT